MSFLKKADLFGIWPDIAGLARKRYANTAPRILKPRNYGTLIRAGRLANAFTLSGSGNTFETIFQIPDDITCLEGIYAQSKLAAGTTATPTILASWASVPNFSAAASDGAVWTAMSKGAVGTWTLIAGASTARRGYTITDKMQAKTVVRDDGGPGRLIAIRTFVSTSANQMCTMGGGAGDAYSGWETEQSGRAFKMRYASGQFAGANYTTFGASALPASTSPLIGIRYQRKNGLVVTIGAYSDSTYDGREPNKAGKSWVAHGTLNLAPSDGTVVEYANFAWPGQAGLSIWYQLIDSLTAGLITDIAVLPLASVNGMSGYVIDDTTMGTERFYSGQMLGFFADNQILPVVTTMAPVTNNAASFPFGNYDARRVSENTQFMSTPVGPVLKFDVSALVSGATVGGQVNLRADYTDDLTHLNAVGNAAVGAAFKNMLVSALPILA